MIDRTLRRADATTILASAIYPLALGLLTGPPGVAIGLVALAVVTVFGRPFGFATVQVGLLGVPMEVAVLGDIAFVAVLVADVARTHRLAARDVAGIVGAIAGLAAIVGVVAALAAFDLVVSAIALVATVALVSYGLHRYTVVMVVPRSTEQ